jgi:hypothetical protein
MSEERSIDIHELLKFAREQGEMTKNIQAGVNHLIESQLKMIGSQNHMIGLLDELKPLRSLPEISNNLTTIVNKLIEPATNPKRKVDWVAAFIIGLLGTLLAIFILKENIWKGKADLFGNHAEIESMPYEKKTQSTN